MRLEAQSVGVDSLCCELHTPRIPRGRSNMNLLLYRNGHELIYVKPFKICVVVPLPAQQNQPRVTNHVDDSNGTGIRVVVNKPNAIVDFQVSLLVSMLQHFLVLNLLDETVNNHNQLLSLLRLKVVVGTRVTISIQLLQENLKTSEFFQRHVKHGFS